MEKKNELSSFRWLSSSFFHIYDQISNFTIQIAAQFANQVCVNPLKLIPAIPVEIRPRYIQVPADCVLADPSFLQHLFDAQFQMSIIHSLHLYQKYIG